MYLIISWFYSLGKISGIVPEPKLKNWKTELSREIQEEILHMDSVFQFFSFSVLLTELFRNISGDISEYLRRNWKTEKLKNWIFQRDPGRDAPYGFSFSVFLFFSFSVFQFFSFAYGTIPEYFRKHFRIFAEKLKNWKTEKLNFPERSRKRCSIWIQFFSFSVFQFFSFSVLLTELFRNISGDISEYLRRNWKTEKLKNRKTEKLKKLNFPERSRKRFSIWIQFFSFSVFQFFCFSVLLTELFRRHFGIFAEKLKNWIFQRDPGRDSQMDSVFQFLSFVAE